MAVHRCIPIDAPAEWSRALQGIPHAFAHTWESCYAMQLTSALKTYLYCFEHEDVRIVCPIAERTFEQQTDIVTPYGFSGFVGTGDCVEFPLQWKQFVRQQGYVCGYIGLHPLCENITYYDLHDLDCYNTLHVLNLTLSDKELFANLSVNRKRQLKNWHTILDVILLEKSALIDFFLTYYYDFYRHKNASSVYHFARETIAYVLSLERCANHWRPWCNGYRGCQCVCLHSGYWRLLV